MSVENKKKKERNDYPTSVYPDKGIYKKAKKIFRLKELQGEDISLNKLVNDTLRKFVDDNEELLEKAKKLNIGND